MKTLSFLFVLLITGAAVAQSNPPPKVVLAWDAVPPPFVITNYTVYYGGASRAYTNSVSVGTALTATVTNVVRGQTYYFAVTAKDTNNLESVYSAEVFTTIPTPPPAPDNLKIQ